MRCLAIAALLAGAPARGEANDEEVETVPARLTATLAGTSVRMQATFAVPLDTPGVVFGAESITIPRDAVVTAASVVMNGKRKRLQLENAEVADRAFDALTVKPGRDGHRATAIVLDGSPGLITINALVPTTGKLTLEMTLEIPTCFYRDMRYIAVPESWWQRVPAAHARVPEADLLAACDAHSPDEVRWLGFASRHLVDKPAGAERIGTIAGRLPLDSTHLARVEIDLARELGDVPADLHTVIMIDHSRSLSPDELEAQRAIVASYLRLAPHSAVQVIGYARTAQPLLPGWMMASHAAPRLDRMIRALPQRNGSNVDAALVEAATWLARARGTRRIILFSDERLTERLSSAPTESLRPLLPPNTLLHVVHPTGIGDELERVDDGLLAPLAATTEGIEVMGAVSEDGKVDATMLLRPTAIDQLEIGALGWKQSEAIDESCLTTLREGHSCTWWGEGGAASGPIAITGLLWNRKLTRVVRPDPALARNLARILTVRQTLDEALQQQVDRLALAVNSVWSLFAVWGGSGGYQDLGGLGSFGFGRFGTSSHDHIGTIGPGHGVAAIDLRDQLQPAVDRCSPGAAAVQVTVETTHHEIVAVGVQVAPANPTLQTCIVEAVWETTLTIPAAPSHAITRVAFGNMRA